MAETAPKDFNQAVSEFLSFLVRERVANETVWIFPEDLQLVDEHFYVAMPIPGGNLARAREKYREGLQRGLGIELSVICWFGDCACSYVYVPESEREAELHLMPIGLPTRLKLSYPARGDFDDEPTTRRDERREAIPVMNKFTWMVLSRKGTKNEEIKTELFD